MNYVHRGLPGHRADRAELPRPHLARQVQHGDHARRDHAVAGIGPVGLVSRSGTLTYQAVHELTQRGIGQTTCVGIGGDPVPGTGFIDCLSRFEADPETKACVMIGEIGGSDEETAAAFIASEMTKPVVAYVAGVTAPAGKKMGHAGAIVSGSKGTAAAKIEALEKAGCRVGRNPSEIGELMAEVLKGVWIHRPMVGFGERARPVARHGVGGNGLFRWLRRTSVRHRRRLQPQCLTTRPRRRKACPPASLRRRRRRRCCPPQRRRAQRRRPPGSR